MASRCFALVVLVLALVALSATALAAPGDDFSFTPSTPNVGDPVVFTCEPSPCPASATVEWDFDGGTDFERTGHRVTTTFQTAGVHTVRMRLMRDGEATTPVSKPVTVNGPPVVSFDFTPTSPLPGVEVWFDQVVTDPNGDSVTLAWNFGDGGVAAVEDPRHTYATPGTRTVTLTATDAHGLATTETRQLTVQDPSGPTPSFTVSPALPRVGEVVTFTNTSTASSGSITSAVWDLDNDGEFDDSPGGWSFATPGIHEVALRVTQTNGAAAVKEISLRVNAPPFAAFVWSPSTPVAGQPSDLISVSSDSDGPLGAQAWDLDGDGGFDDAIGPRAAHVFPSAGTYAVGLRVADSDGLVAVSRQAVTVAAAPGASPVDDEPAFITPFPVVRLAGTVLAHAARVQVLAVRAPRGSLIRVTCGGKGCPVRAVRRTSRGRGVRFAQFERRLRAGLSLEIFIRKPGLIGKYTRFLIRAGAPPKRADLCLFPSRQTPRRCP
jgi:PKD repeat protein